MTDSFALAVIRTVHTVIYLMMVAAICVLLDAGVTGYKGLMLWVALALLAVESAVFAGNGMKCPLTSLAVRHGAQKGFAFDTLLPERLTRYTFRFFGALTALGFLLLVLRWAGVLG